MGVEAKREGVRKLMRGSCFFFNRNLVVTHFDFSDLRFTLDTEGNP